MVTMMALLFLGFDFFPINWAISALDLGLGLAVGSSAVYPVISG